ncbi:MAG: hypothetical protein ACK2U3_09430 [Anaerolineales bacterium]
MGHPGSKREHVLTHCVRASDHQQFPFTGARGREFELSSLPGGERKGSVHAPRITHVGRARNSPMCEGWGQKRVSQSGVPWVGEWVTGGPTVGGRFF